MLYCLGKDNFYIFYYITGNVSMLTAVCLRKSINTISRNERPVCFHVATMCCVCLGRIVLHGPFSEGVCHADELHYLFSPRLWGARHTLREPRSHTVLSHRSEIIVVLMITAYVRISFLSLKGTVRRELIEVKSGINR
jgi:hypothetical protein